MLLTDLPNIRVLVDFRPTNNLHLLSSVLCFTQTTTQLINNDTPIFLASFTVILIQNTFYV